MVKILRVLAMLAVITTAVTATGWSQVAVPCADPMSYDDCNTYYALNQYNECVDNCALSCNGASPQLCNFCNYGCEKSFNNRSCECYAQFCSPSHMCPFI